MEGVSKMVVKAKPQQLVGWMLDLWLQSPAFDLDGSDVQEALHKYGFLKTATYDPVKHGEIDDVEPGDECLILTLAGKKALRSLRDSSPTTIAPTGNVDGER